MQRTLAIASRTPATLNFLGQLGVHAVQPLMKLDIFQ
jgi:hypothetical protein